jgi:translation initiation factor IF-2
MESEKTARKRAEEVAGISHEDALAKRKKFSIATLKSNIAKGRLTQVKVIVKADSNGTLEAVKNEVEKIKTEEAFAKVIHSGVGEISESDVMLAAAGDGDAIIVGFNVKAAGRIKKIAEKEGVEILAFDVIYHLTEKINEILLGSIEDEETESIIGEFKVKAVFAANKKMAVLGGDVLSGAIRKAIRFRVFREQKNEETGENEEVQIGIGKIDSVQLGQKVVHEVQEGTECGLKVDHKELGFQEGDRLELFSLKKKH